MDASTGKPVSGLDHLRQSIRDILTTPIGSRVGRRDYGSLLPELVDQPMNATGRLRLFAATAVALMRWEPRIKLQRIGLEAAAEPGAFTLTIEAVRTDTAPANARALLTVPLRPSGSLAAYA